MTISDTLGYRLVFRFFFFLPHYDAICGLLLNNFHHLSPHPPLHAKAPLARLTVTPPITKNKDL